MDRTFLDWPFFEKRHHALVDQLTEWCAAVPLAVIDKDESASCRRLVSRLGDDGWLRHVVPAAWGGARSGIDVRAVCLIRETLAYHASLADFAFAMQGLGSGPISLFGSNALREKYLPRVAAGNAVCAFALSELEAGSNVSAIATVAERRGDRYEINGSKTWISNAGVADFYVVFARSEAQPGHRGLSAFVVDAGTPGMTVTENIQVTSPHPLGSLSFENCAVADSQLIGGPGDGFKIAMATLDVFRSTVGAAALGFARRAMDEACTHAGRREVFERKLADFQMTRERIAEMATEIDASALLVYRSAWTKDTGAERVTREAAMAKYYATEAAQRVIDSAVQLLGARGVVRGEIVESLYRDIRPLRIYEGTTEIQKLIIAKEVLEDK